MKSVAEFLQAVAEGQRDFTQTGAVPGEVQSDFERAAYLAKVAKDNGYIEDTNFDVLADGAVRTVRVGKITALGRALLSLMRDERR